jgi:hypothetical protein
MDMKKFELYIKSKKTDKGVTRTTDISDDLFDMINAPLNMSWGEDLEMMSRGKEEKIWDALYLLHDTVINIVITQRFGFDDYKIENFDLGNNTVYVDISL